MSYTLKYTGSEIDDILDRAVAGGEIDTELAGKQDVLTFDDAPTAGSSNPVKSGGILTAIERGTVDTARAVLSNEKTTDTAPYLYRLNPHGNRVKPCIVGASVGANQTYKPAGTAGTYLGLTVTANADESTTVSGTSTSTGNIGLQVNNPSTYPSVYTKDHIYALYGMQSGVQNARLNRFVGVQMNDYGSGVICKATGNGTATDSVRVVIENINKAYNFTVRPQFIDLTLMLGSAIAEKALEKEQSVAGSGIAWLRSYGLLPEAYEAYNAGSIKSVNTSGRKTVGVNQWDEQTRLGTYDSSTGAYNSGYNDRLCTKNKISVLPSTTYYLAKSGQQGNIYYYDANDAFISSEINKGGSTFTTPSNCRYVNVSFGSAYGATYHNDISINYPSTDHDYHAYEAYTYPTEATDLRGILKLSGDTIYADGDLYPPSGEGTRKYGVLDLGAQDWTYSGGGFYTNVIASLVKKPASTSELGNYICNKLTQKASAVAWSENNQFSIASNGNLWARTDGASSDPAAFKTAMSGVYLVYELATPTTASLAPYTEIQQALTTEEWLGSEVPVGQSSEYYKDIVAAIEGIPEAPTSDGTYTLKVAVSGGVATYSWEA